MPTLSARGCHAEEMKSLIPSHGFASYKLTYSTTIIVLQQLARCQELVGFSWWGRYAGRSVVKQKITPCKTEASRKPIPLDAELAEVLFRWRLQCPYPQSGDWVFVSPHRKGRQPYWPGSLFRAHLKPALQAAKIPGNVGWHTLRHTFGTLMKANGEDIKTIQELLRHSNYKVTADTYTQAVTPTKRAAQTKLVKMILLPGKKKA